MQGILIDSCCTGDTKLQFELSSFKLLSALQASKRDDTSFVTSLVDHEDYFRVLHMKQCKVTEVTEGLARKQKQPI